MGVRAVELDVRPCASGEVVVFHDPTLKRLTAGRDVRRVEDVPVAELRAIDLGLGGTVATLAEVVTWARESDVALNVELKHDVPSRIDIARATSKVLRDKSADVLLSSFDPVLLAVVAALMPSVPRALLTQARQAFWTDGLQQAARPPWLNAVHVEVRQALADGVSGYLSRGLRVGVWTVNDPDQAAYLAHQGVATLITDSPDRVLAALAVRSSP
jgi:glycerophosphoryl diester phosphodiesterase